MVQVSFVGSRCVPPYACELRLSAEKEAWREEAGRWPAQSTWKDRQGSLASPPRVCSSDTVLTGSGVSATPWLVDRPGQRWSLA